MLQSELERIEELFVKHGYIKSNFMTGMVIVGFMKNTKKIVLFLSFWKN